jgi:2-iminoacetate synthase
MTFSSTFERQLAEPPRSVRAFARLLDAPAGAPLGPLIAESTRVTRAHFGRAMRLFAPLYLSNECINNCQYCGFSRDNPILRITLDTDQVEREARHLAAEGFRSLLLVAGEHPKFVSSGYLETCLHRLRPLFPSLAIEVGPMETAEYRPLVAAGAEGLVVYQETYHRDTYARMHTAGPKRDFDWRLDTPERGHAAGFRRIGVGALFGLHDWREEAIALALHLDHLLKTCWRAQLTVSLPRLRPAPGGFAPSHPLPDRDFVRLICAFRLTFPTVGIVLSTREPAALRDALLPLGVTLMSAGSHTEPGGYTGQRGDGPHLTVRGRRVEPSCATADDTAAGQFEIADSRSAAEIAAVLRRSGLDPVWKDWDEGLLTA